MLAKWAATGHLSVQSWMMSENGCSFNDGKVTWYLPRTGDHTTYIESSKYIECYAKSVQL